MYLPTASYHEMGEWTLSPEAGRALLNLKKRLQSLGLLEEAEPFLHGGIWMGFLAKYPEANILHKRMMWASRKVQEAMKASPAVDATVERARRALYRGQCNCPYWHGLFGGLYLPHLRHAVYQQLVQAEALVDLPSGPHAERHDLDADLQEEGLLVSSGTSVWVDPAEGGQVVVFDDRRRGVSLAHVLSRRPETYHEDLLAAQKKKEHESDDGPRSIHDLHRSKVPDLEQRMVYDPYLRRVCVDHLLPAGASLASLSRGPEKVLADLVRVRYELTEAAQDAGAAWLELQGAALVEGASASSLLVTKRFRLVDPALLEVSYQLAFESIEPDARIEALFAVESALALVPGPPEDFHVSLVSPAQGEPIHHSPREAGLRELASRVVAASSLGGARIEMTPLPAAQVSWFPLETVSQSEDGAELVYQGTAVAFGWPLTLTAGTTQQFVLNFALL